MRDTKIGFLVKNICGPQIDEDEAEDDKSSEKANEEEKPDHPADEVETPAPIRDNNLNKAPPEIITKEEKEEDRTPPHRLGVKGPKKRLTQIPKHE